MNIIIDIYAQLFGRRAFYKLNKLLYLLSIRGIGILNYKNDHLSGERHFINSLKKRYNSNEVYVFDVGANQGDYSLAIREIFPNAEIHSFEPHPKTFIDLKECARKNNFFAYNFGIGECNAKLKLYDYAGNEESGSQHASIFRDVIESIHKGSSQSFDVDIITLDAFVKEHRIKLINLLKIDTEGNELNVLKGASECLKNNIIDIIHIEFNEMNIVSRVYMKDFFDLLYNFKFYRMLSDGLVPLTYNPLTCEIFAYQNIVAVRNT